MTERGPVRVHRSDGPELNLSCELKPRNQAFFTLKDSLSKSLLPTARSGRC